jgi:hypothetical protein
MSSETTPVEGPGAKLPVETPDAFEPIFEP